MINLSKSSSSLVVTSDDKNVFPFKDGTLSLPMNSLYFVLDESNYVSFKQATDNNQLFGASINDLTINGTPATKENIITLFDSVANSTNSGGGGEGGAVSSVNGQTGAVVITPQNIGTYTSAQIDTKVNAKQDTLVSGTNIKTINGETILGEGDITITSTPTSVEWNDVQNKPTFATVATSGDYNDLTNKPEIPSLEGYATESFVTTAVSGESTERQKQDTALGGMIAAETEAREAADSAINQTIATKQDTLVSGTNIKTINSQSILGQGNIEIQVEGGGITDAPNDGKLYGRKSEQWSEVVIPDTSNLATKSEIPTKVSQLSNDANYITSAQATEAYQPKGDYITTETADSKYQAKGDYITTTVADGKYQAKGDYALVSAIPTNVSQLTNDSNYITEEEATSQFAASADLEEKQDVLISGTNIKTINGASILGEGNISIETPEGGISDAPKDGNTYARKDGAWTAITIPSLDGYLTETAADGKYQPKGNYLTEIPSEYVTDSELNGKGYLTAQEASETYQPIGDYALKSELPSTANLVTTEELNEAISGKANTSDLSNYLTKTDAESTYAKETSLEGLESSKLDVSTYNQDKATFALKSELPDTSDMLTKTEASSTYQPKGDYITTTVADGKYQPKGEYATDEELSGKQDTLVSGTNIKTINNQSLLGSGNISIEGGGTSYTAGEGISIQGSTISTTLSKEWFGTQQEYDELQSKDANTLYYISE